MYVFGPPVWERVPVEARKGCRIPCSWIYRRLCAELPSMDAENLTLVLCKISKCSHVPHRLPNPMELRVKGSSHLCAYLFVCRCTQCTPLWREGDNLSCHSSSVVCLGFWDMVSPLRDICLTGWPVSLRDLPVLTAPALGLRHIPLSFFFMWVQDPMSDIPACQARTLLTTLPPQLPLSAFLYSVLWDLRDEDFLPPYACAFIFSVVNSKEQVCDPDEFQINFYEILK